MKKKITRFFCLFTSLMMFMSGVSVVNAEETPSGYVVTFACENASVDVYYTQNYVQADETNVSTALARNSGTGEIDISGDGQVNFKVNPDEGYSIVSVAAEGNYKNLKKPDETGYERTYKITKIKGAVTVNVKTEKTQTETETTSVSYDVVINEIESNGDVNDWVELYNKGTEAVDISGWYILDNDPEHTPEATTTPLADNTVLKPGEYYVLEENKDFTFGLGKADEVKLYDKNGNLVENQDWTEHAFGSLSRIPDGKGDFKDVAVSTKGAANTDQASAEKPTEEPKPETPAVSYDVVVNEIESNGDVNDWVELYNKGTEAVDISGWYIVDDKPTDKTKSVPLKEGTILQPGAFYVLNGDIDFSFGLGDPDEVNLYDKNGNLVEKHSWSAHASGSLSRIPDGTGAMVDTPVTTKNASNQGGETEKPAIKAEAWPGIDKVDTVDDGLSMFLSDSSGLDFADGKLYAINNKNGTFWVLNVTRDGSVTYADGFTKNGKNLAFAYDADPSSSNPDTEGITVDASGMAYAAAERDNNNKNVNANWILQFNPWTQADTVVASKEWNITSLLPDVAANAGIEAVEWVADEDVKGRLIDENTGKAYDPSVYNNRVAGVFFTALEYNGHIYAFVLNNDGTAVLINETDSTIGGAMALDYDTYEDVLWVGYDDGYGNVSAKITWNGTETPEVKLYSAPAGMDVSRNNEGMAITTADYTVNGVRPVYHFMDGVETGVLTVSYLNCDYQDGSSEPQGTVTETVDVKTEVAGTIDQATAEKLKETLKQIQVSNVVDQLKPEVRAELLKGTESKVVELRNVNQVKVTDADFKGEYRTVTFEIVPSVEVVVDGQTVKTEVINNADLTGKNITVTLPLNGLEVKEIIHESKGYPTEYIHNFVITKGGNVTFNITHFSTFTLSEKVTAASSAKPAVDTGVTGVQTSGNLYLAAWILAGILIIWYRRKTA